MVCRGDCARNIIEAAGGGTHSLTTALDQLRVSPHLTILARDPGSTNR